MTWAIAEDAAAVESKWRSSIASQAGRVRRARREGEPDGTDRQTARSDLRMRILDLDRDRRSRLLSARRGSSARRLETHWRASTFARSARRCFRGCPGAWRGSQGEDEVSMGASHHPMGTGVASCDQAEQPCYACPCGRKRNSPREACASGKIPFSISDRLNRGVEAGRGLFLEPFVGFGEDLADLAVIEQAADLVEGAPAVPVSGRVLHVFDRSGEG